MIARALTMPICLVDGGEAEREDSGSGRAGKAYCDFAFSKWEFQAMKRIMMPDFYYEQVMNFYVVHDTLHAVGH